jgi:7,8-dihydro-6-hydroxymethylpterin-pyrophosphokinase
LILIALGSNLPSHYGSPERTLAAALKKLDEVGIRVKVQRRSRVYTVRAGARSPTSRGIRNAVASCADGSASPMALMALLHARRSRISGVSARATRDEARLLDLDIIAYKTLHLWTKSGLVLAASAPAVSGRLCCTPCAIVASRLDATRCSKLGTLSRDDRARCRTGMKAEPLAAADAA